MGLKVAAVQLWSGRLDDAVGGAAKVLAPLSAAKVDLEFVLVRRTAEEPGRGIAFVAPVKGAKAEAAARAAGLAPAADVAALRVEGDNKAGAGHGLVAAIAAAGVSFRGLSASVFGRKYVCHVAFDRPEDAAKVADALRSAGRKRR
jgi:hypothetical protein